MSFGLSRGRELDDTGIAVTAAELPPLPDSALTDPRSAHVDPRAWFPDPSRPLEIEIGSGKGTFILQQGEREAALPGGANLLGIEWAREFYLYAADRVRRRGLTNVRMMNTDATEFLHWRVPDRCVRVIHLYFPDPWPKTRHHRRRTISDRFLADAARVLEHGGELRVVTDHDELWAWMEDHFARWASPSGETHADITPSGQARTFIRLPFDRPESAGEGELVGTNFERKYRREGRPFHATVLRLP